MSSGAASSSGMRWPDVAVGVGCVLLIGALGWVAFGPRNIEMSADVVVAQQLRSIHVGMLLYGLDNDTYLPGLSADGSLLTNDPAERFDLLIAGNYLTPDLLVSPADARPDAATSYAILDISQPGGRRDAWTTLDAPDAPILAESPAARDQPSDPAAWSGWVLWHRSDYATPQSPAVEHADSPRLRTRYSPAGPFNENDDLFAATGPDDAYLLSADR